MIYVIIIKTAFTITEPNYYESWIIYSRAAGQSQMFSARGGFGVFGYAKHKNQNKNNLKNREQLVQGPQS